MKPIPAEKLTKGRALALLATAALGSPSALLAQDPAPAADAPGAGPQEIEAMVSTGSLIPQSEIATSLPVTVLDRKFIEKAGVATVTDLLQKLPQNTGARFKQTVNTGVSFSPGAAAVSLRGLNVNSTLVLLNGRRMAPFAQPQSGTDSFVDINSIPLAAIESVEVLREGASALYGSDAIAGVVNIITRRDFVGTEIFGQYGNTTRTDDVGESHASLTTGFNAEKYRFLLSVDLYKQNPLSARNRGFSYSADHRDQGGTDLRSSRPNPGTFFTPFGTFRPPYGNDGRPSADEFLTGTDRNGGFKNRYNFNERTELIPQQNRTGYFGTAEYDLTSNLSIFGEVLYQENRTKEIAAPTPIDSADNLFVPAVNPYNPFGEPVYFLYRLLEGGNRLTLTNSETSRYTGGFRLKNLPNNWTAEVAYFNSENKSVSQGKNFFSKQRAQEALFKTDPDKALNVFGDGLGYNSPEVIDGMRVDTYQVGRSELRTADFRASGDLFSLPAGPVGLGIGAEYREEEFSLSPDPRSRRGDIIGSGGVTADGQRSSKSAFFQVDVPITSPTWNVPGIYSLNLIAAGRYEEATDFGDTFKPKFSIRYKPVEKLTLRASYQEGYRAPSLAQLFLGEVVGFETVTDPLNASLGAIDYRSVTSGNTALQPETAYAYSAGFVLDVPYLDGLSIDMDFFRIEQRNRIDAPTAQFVVDNPGFGSVVRDADGFITQINTPFANIGKTVTDGLDFGVNYELPWKKYGTWTLSFDGTYINTFEETPQPGFENVEFIGTFQQPRFRCTAGLDYALGGFGANVFLDFTDGYEDVDLEPQRQRQVEGWMQWNAQVSYEWKQPEEIPFEGKSKDGKTMLGKSVVDKDTPIANGGSWWQKILYGTKVAFGVNNISDEDPPFVNLTEGYDTSTYDPRGRFYYVSITKKF